MRSLLLGLLVLSACSGDDDNLPPLTTDTALKCPAPAGLPFRTDTTGWQQSANATLVGNDPRNKDEASDLLGNPGGLAANIFIADTDVPSATIAYHGIKARTTINGGLFSTALPGENVSLWSYDGTAWASEGNGKTDANGEYDLPATYTAPNNHVLYSVLEADGSCAEHLNMLLPPGSKVVITDIDGTLTTDDNQSLMQIPDATYVPLMMGAANTMLQAWDGKKYPIIYLTARPRVLREESRVWLRDESFPTGPLITANDVEEASAYKTLWLNRLIQTFGWVPVAAYGNAATDVTAYENVGIAKDITFIVGPLAGTGGTVAIPNMDFTAHIASFVDPQPDNTP
jgi:LNS2 (Lipin/Ned1/Smp2)